MIDLEELKQTIEQRTGVPASLLTGETEEEIISAGKALLALKREANLEGPKTTREKFSSWFSAYSGMEPKDEAGEALAEIEEEARLNAGGYPRVQDAGEVTGLSDPRPAREQFAEWLGKKSAWDPFKEPYPG